MDISPILKAVAPWISSALLGPLGGMAVSAVANALGLTDKTTDAIKQAIGGATPEQLLALKQADQGFALQMQELGFKQLSDLEAIAAGDRKDARDMQKSVRSWVPAALSCGITVGYFAVLIGMMTGRFSISDNQAMLLMLGSLSTAWVSVMAFWFGTTNSSQNKNALIARTAK